VLSPVTRRTAVERTMREILDVARSSAYLFGVNPETYGLLMEPGRNTAAALKAQTGKHVVIVPEPECTPLEVRVLIEGATGSWGRARKL